MMSFCERSGDCCLYRVTYATNGDLLAHWDLMAKSTEHALQSASALLPIGSKVMFAHLKEEW
jgi:hypothetical protein